jgi:putative DNA primase/helicase
VSAEQIGIALKGRRNGSGWLVCCPCPSHGKGRGDRNPSLSVADGDERLLLRCFAGCEFVDILDELKRRGLIEGSTAPPRPRAVLCQAPEHLPDPAALHIIDESRAARGTVVEEYLQRRGIPLLPSSLLCGSYQSMPAMVAIVHRPGGMAVAVQRTILTADGMKADLNPSKITTGALGAGAVCLAPPAKIMGIAEGIETALSAQIMADIPVWASLGSSRLHRVALPDLCQEVHIFVDNDEPGRTAAKRAADIHTSLGRRVYLRYPPDQCGDWNDFLILIADRDGCDVSQSHVGGNAENAA